MPVQLDEMLEYLSYIVHKRKHRNKILYLLLVWFVVLGLTACGSSTTEPVATSQKEESSVSKEVSPALDYESLGLLEPIGEKQFSMKELDELKRATEVHIQLREKDRPSQERPDKITVDPIGWHNYRFYYEDGAKEDWLMNRGHLVAFTFCGVNDDLRNIVPMTKMLNIGGYSKSDASNSSSMLYYEMGLRDWLSKHGKEWLDYRVVAVYQEDELLPRSIELQYAGVDEKGNLIPIILGSSQEVQDNQGITHVRLENSSPNAEIDYAEGTAENTVAKLEKTVENKQVEAPSKEDPIVYVASKGKSKAYWYSKSDMPPQTKLENVVEMKESEALAKGKHHSKIE